MVRVLDNCHVNCARPNAEASQALSPAQPPVRPLINPELLMRKSPNPLPLTQALTEPTAAASRCSGPCLPPPRALRQRQGPSKGTTGNKFYSFPSAPHPKTPDGQDGPSGARQGRMSKRGTTRTSSLGTATTWALPKLAARLYVTHPFHDRDPPTRDHSLWKLPLWGSAL